MNEQWRTALYGLGYLSSVAFGARFLIQWLDSERKQRSVVTPLFWKLSLAGNLLLLAHAFIQVQVHVFLIQACNAVISWRNLNLMHPTAQRLAFASTLKILTAALSSALVVSLVRYFFFLEEGPFIRVPITPWNPHPESEVFWLWHLLGWTGLILFNSRFWVQWWNAEQSKHSSLGLSFWWISLMGDSLCLTYFARLGDPVNLIGPLFGLVPYIRNIMLLKKTKPIKEFT